MKFGKVRIPIFGWDSSEQSVGNPATLMILVNGRGTELTGVDRPKSAHKQSIRRRQTTDFTDAHV